MTIFGPLLAPAGAQNGSRIQSFSQKNMKIHLDALTVFRSWGRRPPQTPPEPSRTSFFIIPAPFRLHFSLFFGEFPDVKTDVYVQTRALPKTPTKTPAKTPAKTLTKTLPKTLAKTLFKTPAKTLAKTPAQTPAKTLPKTPVKTLPKTPTKTPVKTPAKTLQRRQLRR